MIKVFFETCGAWPLLPIVQSYAGTHTHGQHTAFLRRALDGISEQFVARVESPGAADYILLPHWYEDVVGDVACVSRAAETARACRKALLIFMYGDDILPCDWPAALVFRSSTYRSDLGERDIVLPPIVEDLLGDRQLAVRSLPRRPVVGFVGFAGFHSLSYNAKTRWADIVLRTRLGLRRGGNAGARRCGIFLRMEMVRRFRRDPRVDTRFVIRRTYSGYTRHMEQSEITQIRDEYRANILDCDATLAPRGYGNFSQRFYECLSLGRCPILIDTDVALPLENLIDYERFVIRVPYASRRKAVDFVLSFFEGLSAEEFGLRQREAREAFTKHLSVSAFHRFMFTNEYINTIVSRLDSSSAQSLVETATRRGK